MIWLTSMVIVAVGAQGSTSGLKVYNVVVVLFKAGLQTPVILLVEVVGNADKVPPTQIAGTWVNVGVMIWLTSMVIVAVGPQGSTSGLKVYNVVVVLSSAGLHVPVI